MPNKVLANLWTQQVVYWYSTTMGMLSNRNEVQSTFIFQLVPPALRSIMAVDSN